MRDAAIAQHRHHRSVQIALLALPRPTLGGMPHEDRDGEA
jgi:hypothetical protein